MAEAEHYFDTYEIEIDRDYFIKQEVKEELFHSEHDRNEPVDESRTEHNILIKSEFDWQTQVQKNNYEEWNSAEGKLLLL